MLSRIHGFLKKFDMVMLNAKIIPMLKEADQCLCVDNKTITAMKPVMPDDDEEEGDWSV